MRLFVSVLSLLICVLLTVHIIGCSNYDETEEVPEQNTSINTEKIVDETDAVSELAESSFKVPLKSLTQHSPNSSWRRNCRLLLTLGQIGVHRVDGWILLLKRSPQKIEIPFS